MFESTLKKGKFVVGECPKCQKITWPPNDFCSICFESLSWRNVREPGILIEYSTKDDRRFGIVEFEKTVRVMGVLTGNFEPKPGQKIRITSCDFDGVPKITFTTL